MIRADGRFDDEVSLVAQPIFVQNEFKGAVLLISPISGVEQMVNQVNLYMFYAVISTLVITILVSWLLSKFHVKRIQKLREATDKVASGDYDIHLENSYGDEIGVLASDFNIMAKKLKQSRDEIDRLEKRRRQFIADVSHELKTPLTTINGLVEGLNSHTIPEDKKDKCFSLISEETKRMLRLVKENLDYEKIRSQQITLNKLNVPLIEVFEIVKEHLQQQAEEKQNKLMIQVEDHVIVHADYDRFIQILVNITKNSINLRKTVTFGCAEWKVIKRRLLKLKTRVSAFQKRILSIFGNGSIKQIFQERIRHTVNTDSVSRSSGSLLKCTRAQ